MCTQCSTDGEAFIRIGNKMARTQNVDFRVVGLNLSIPCSNTQRPTAATRAGTVGLLYVRTKNCTIYHATNEWLLTRIFQQVFLGYLAPCLRRLKAEAKYTSNMGTTSRIKCHLSFLLFPHRHRILAIRDPIAPAASIEL